MRLKNKSIEELLDLEEELQDVKDSEDGGDFTALIAVYESLYKKISEDKNSEYAPSLADIKKRLITSLVYYGTYLKTVYQKDDTASEMCLKKALKYDRNLPIVYYRLGFLHYKSEKYTSALLHFQNANRFQQAKTNEAYRMTDQQSYNCHLYLANCGLFIAVDAKESLDDLEVDSNVNSEAIPKYEISPFYGLINENDAYLEKHAFLMTTNKESKYCSLEACNNAKVLKDTIILDFTTRTNLLIFNDEEVTLSKNQAEMLRYFLINSREQRPILKNDLRDLFAKFDLNGDVRTNSYIQAVKRLRSKIAQVTFKNVIDSEIGHRETAYYYNEDTPFIIMHRDDEPFILD